MDIKKISQFGTDGFGHQIHGMTSCMSLHGTKINDYEINFDPHWSINERPYSFEHISNTESELCKRYIINSLKNFAKRNNSQPNSYQNIFPSSEFWPDTKSWQRNQTKWKAFPKFTILEESRGVHTLHLYDNLWETSYQTGAMQSERDNMKLDWVTNNDKLPANRFNEKYTNIVIHVRLGDATKRSDNKKLSMELDSIIKKIIADFESPKIIIHTNGELAIETCEFIEVKNKQTPVLEVLSDLIHSDIMISGGSSLSAFAVWVRPDKKNVCTKPASLNKRKSIRRAHSVGYLPTGVLNINEFLKQ